MAASVVSGSGTVLAGGMDRTRVFPVWAQAGPALGGSGRADRAVAAVPDIPVAAVAAVVPVVRDAPAVPTSWRIEAAPPAPPASSRRVPRRLPRMARPVAGAPASGATAFRSRPGRARTAFPTRARPVAFAPRKLRLTRRGRIVGLLLVATIVYGAFGLGRASAGPDRASGSAQEVVVAPGDSLWTIAVRTMPGADPRDVVARLKSLNHLAGAQLDIGQRLRLR
jgi:nucleoid-associated protein YgaU